jgi:acetyl-CoA synthetase
MDTGGMDKNMDQMNIAYLCSTFHCENGNGQRLAMRWVDADFSHVDYSYADLNAESNQFANVFQALGIQPGERVGLYLPKLPQVFFALLGILKIQAVACPLFSNFGEDALLDRLGDSGTSVLITRRSLLRKVAPIRDRLPDLKYILVLDIEEDQPDGIKSLPALLRNASTEFNVPITSADCPSLLHYTSGSTGKPKGVLHRHSAAETIRRTAEEILQIEPNELYWCTADQAWITGTSYGVFAPWLLGAAHLHFGGGFRWAAPSNQGANTP